MYQVQKEDIVRVPAGELQLAYPEIQALGWVGFKGELG